MNNNDSQVIFKRVPLASLEPHPSNYNNHPPAQIADLKASLIRYKQVKPVVVQQITGEEQYIILAGHGITEAAKELYDENPVKYAHLNNWSIAIVPESWSIMTAKGYIISDNETTRKAEIDENILAQLLREQQEAGYDLASLGSDDHALEDMLAKLTPPTLEELEKEYGDEPEEDAFWPTIRVKVSPETKELYESLMEDAEGTDESTKFAWLLERIDVAMEDDEGDEG
jgi:hypothetical protein